MKPLWANDFEIRESRFFPLDVRGEERRGAPTAIMADCYLGFPPSGME